VILEAGHQKAAVKCATKTQKNLNDYELHFTTARCDNFNCTTELYVGMLWKWKVGEVNFTGVDAEIESTNDCLCSKASKNLTSMNCTNTNQQYPCHRINDKEECETKFWIKSSDTVFVMTSGVQATSCVNVVTNGLGHLNDEIANFIKSYTNYTGLGLFNDDNNFKFIQDLAQQATSDHDPIIPLW
jgi:hypothetical protein